MKPMPVDPDDLAADILRSADPDPYLPDDSIGRLEVIPDRSHYHSRRQRPAGPSTTRAVTS